MEFLLGKQLPYIGLAFVNFSTPAAFAVIIFRVPFTGSFITLSAAALLYVIVTIRHGPRHIVLHEKPDRSDLRHVGDHAAACCSVLRHHRPRLIASGLGQADWRDLSDHVFQRSRRGTFSKGLDFSNCRLVHTAAAGHPCDDAVGAALLSKQER